MYCSTKVTQPGHPFMGRCTEYQQKLGRGQEHYANPISVVTAQCKQVSGWRLKNEDQCHPSRGVLGALGFAEGCLLPNRSVVRKRSVLKHHRLNGSSSPVLTATSLSYGKSKNSTPHRIKTPQSIQIKFGTVDYVGEGTRHAKFYANSSKGGFSANGWNIRKNFYLYMPFFPWLTHRSDLLRDFNA